MIVERDIEGVRTVIVYEATLVYEIGLDEAYEVSHAGRRRVSVPYAIERVRALRLQERESRLSARNKDTFY